MSDDPKARIDANLVECTLDTLADGELEARFQKHLAEWDDVEGEPGLYQESPKGCISGEITLKVQLLKDLETGFQKTEVGSAFSGPKLRKIVRPIYRREDGFLVDKPVEQTTLRLAPPAANEGESS